MLGLLREPPWIKARAVVPALERADARTVAIVDGDVACDGLLEAFAAVEGGAPWAIPHRLVHRLGPDSSPAEPPYAGMPGGGIVVAPRETLLRIPLDPRFIGWGQEDESWAVALSTLAGEPWRGEADLLHHWHPPQPRLSRTRGSREGWVLRRRYLRARYDAGAMQAIINEAQWHLRDCSRATAR